MQLNTTLSGLALTLIVSACGGGSSSALSAPAPVTPSPVTPAPVTPAPVTPAPVTPAPVTPAPVVPTPPVLSAACVLPVTIPASKSGLPWCTSLASDSDGDGTGAENAAACQMRSAADIVNAMGVGWNLGNTMDATGNTASPLGDETFWGNPVTTRANIDALKAAGFNTLRLPVSWDDHLSGAARTIDPAWMDRVEQIANYALANNMYVIINIHHNNGWEAPTLANEAVATDTLVKLWKQIGARFNQYDQHVIFETMNEPRVAVAGVDDWNGKQEYFDVVNRLNAAALAAIRTSGNANARRLVMLPGYVAGPNPLQLDAIVLPDDQLIALSTHAYSPYDFALNQQGTATFTGQAELDAMFARLNSKFIARGVPVVMGEWASTNKANLGERVKQANYFTRAARKLNIPTIWWDNGNSVYTATSTDIMGLLDRKTNTWIYPEIVAAATCHTP